MNPNPEDKLMNEINTQRVAEFSAAVNDAVEECAEFEYVPRRFNRMLKEKGALETAK